jgi:hypothetical protein
MIKKITIKGINMIEALGLGGLPEKKQDEIIKRMSNIIHNRILLKMVKKMNKKDIELMNGLLKKKDNKGIDKFLEKKFPDFTETWKKEVVGFREEMIKGSRV